MKRILIGRVGLLCVLAAVAGNAVSMEYKAEGSVLTLSGMVTGDDPVNLKVALAPSIRYVVLNAPKGNDFQDALYAAHAVQDAKVTTVVRGYCGYACARMFLAGQRRMFSGDGSIENSVVELSARASYFDFTKTSDDSANLKAVVDFPWRVWMEYVFPNTGAGSFSVGAILVQHPDVKNSAAVLGCSPQAKRKVDCTALSELNAVDTKVVTTSELFRMKSLPQE